MNLPFGPLFGPFPWIWRILDQAEGKISNFHHHLGKLYTRTMTSKARSKKRIIVSSSDEEEEEEEEKEDEMTGGSSPSQTKKSEKEMTKTASVEEDETEKQRQIAGLMGGDDLDFLDGIEDFDDFNTSEINVSARRGAPFSLDPARRRKKKTNAWCK